MKKKILTASIVLLALTASAQHASDHLDWANIKRYEQANSQVIPTQTGKKSVIYMGDSITDFWIKTDSSFFAGKPYLDRGISGRSHAVHLQ